MKINEFTKKYQIELSEEAQEICEDGIKLMKKAKDPLHSDVHVEDLLSALDEFLKNTKQIKSKDIDFDVLLPSICWHDVWKSQRPQTSNLFKFKYEQWWDGIGSANIFRKYSKQKGIPLKLDKEISYVISHHAGILTKRRTPKKYTEARIINDLDSLEFWSMNRLKQLESVYLDENGKFHNPKLISLANWLLKKFSKTVECFYFNWPEEEFSRRKEELLKRGHEIMERNTKK